jgi:hypothetical protein
VASHWTTDGRSEHIRPRGWLLIGRRKAGQHLRPISGRASGVPGDCLLASAHPRCSQRCAGSPESRHTNRPLRSLLPSSTAFPQCVPLQGPPRDQGSGFRDQGSGFRDQGLGFGV